ncbi:hypothetical protein BZG02_05515 [Labilibaculum filiforme]|uniref:OmpR/PhoB-type domain-containing protein n=1 Tax=Labilibaculum filiforme TaxID=1940526 RepID=A0A2N3I1X1_9BACT|nr:hypothetical protein [Labilibaculum filiforme]PKQ64277.1 hypothetical protein BZG02_05515 [Labilibaculum filiforme]
MPAKDKKLEITEQIVGSNTFKNAPTSIAILRYLVQANIEDRFLKESVIDIEFFGTKADAENNNPRVRVTIYNLRNKLKNYYEREGANDLLQIKIDKGQYSVRFEKQNFKRKRISIPRYKQLIPYSLLLLSLIALIFSHLPASSPKLWKDFFNNKHSTNLFIGDAFGYGGKTISGMAGWTRDFSINSLDEYYALLEEKPELKSTTNPTNFFYSTRMAENATHDLARFFTKWNQNFEIKYGTRTSFSDIKEGNTIYVGRLKDQKNFVYLFNEGNPYFKIKDKFVEFKGHPNIPDTTIFAGSIETELDYTVVSRIPGPNHTEQFLFFSDHDIGVMATVEYFTNADSIKFFSNKYLKQKPYFTAIYKTKGKGRINLDLETILVVPFE